MNGSRDVAIDEPEAVAPLHGSGLIGETEIVERAIQPIAGPVAREDPAGSISAVSRRSKADDQKPPAGRPEAGDRSSPIMRVRKSSNFFARDVLAILDQTRASPAVDDLTLGRQLGHSG